jgi:Trk-type K+ transport system membrane component
LSVILLTISDSDKELLSITFECISAYSTVGLSTGITSDLTVFGKAVIIITMFIGRVSMLSILIAILKKRSSELYRLPSENILIN